MQKDSTGSDKGDNPYLSPQGDGGAVVTPAVDVPLIGNDPRYERWRWQVFFITWLAYGGFYLTRKSFAVAKVSLSKGSSAWSMADMTLVDTAYLSAYAVGQFIWGVSGDKFGTRKVILLGMMASIITAAVMGAVSGVWIMAVLLCIQGLCQSAGWAPLAKNVGEFFSQGERGRVMGLWCTNYAFGGFVASALAGAAADQWGWRFAFWVPAGGLFIVWVLFYFMQVNRPEDVGLPPIEDYHGEPRAVIEPGDLPADEPEGSWRVVAEVCSSGMVWLLGAVYFLLKPTRYLVLLWSPLYVNQRLGTGAATSGILGSMFDLAGPISVLLGGYLSDKVFRTKRMPLSVISLIAVAVLMFFFNRLPDTRLGLGLGFFAVGFLLYIPDSLVSGTAAIDFGTKRGASTAAGLINGCGSIGAVAGNLLPWWMERTLGKGVYIWNHVFIALAISLLLAGLLLLPQWNALPAAAVANNARKDKKT